jgi:hypothetical protein
MLIVLTFVVLADFNYPDFFKEDRDTPLLEILVLRGKIGTGYLPDASQEPYHLKLRASQHFP